MLKAGRKRLVPLALGGALLILLLAHQQVLTTLATILIVDDAPSQAEFIFLLNGENETRPFHAARLYHEGIAPRIVIAMGEESPLSQLGILPNETLTAVRILRRLDVPREAIVVLRPPEGVTSTRDEAVQLREYVEGTSVKRVVLVTSAFHTSRARWIIRRELAGNDVDVGVSAAAHWGFDERDWWRSEKGVLMLFSEYVKWGYYLLNYR